MRNHPNIAKRNARTVERWLNDEGSMWPADLYMLGREAVFALNMVPGQEHYMKHPVFGGYIEQCVERFYAAHSAFVASH